MSLASCASKLQFHDSTKGYFSNILAPKFIMPNEIEILINIEVKNRFVSTPQQGNAKNNNHKNNNANLPILTRALALGSICQWCIEDSFAPKRIADVAKTDLGPLDQTTC